MSTDKGYILIYRSIRDHWLWQEKPYTRGQAWIDLIMSANHSKSVVMFNGRPFEIERGQMLTSLQKLADKWGWSREKTRRFLNDLKATQMIDKKRHNRGTLLTIVNYGFFQTPRDSKRDSKKTQAKQQTGNRPPQTNNVRKNVEKNEERKPAAPFSPPIDEDPDPTDEELRAQGWII